MVKGILAFIVAVSVLVIALLAAPITMPLARGLFSTNNTIGWPDFLMLLSLGWPHLIIAIIIGAALWMVGRTLVGGSVV